MCGPLLSVDIAGSVTSAYATGHPVPASVRLNLNLQKEIVET
jgi:hypothetical protein